ncbi:unnamed protein product [marine sediment metagenome]|uniref:Uncharacterized protein n=1 Tax=marine sediment metagenome TaxID=412755 RepID=X1NNR2_9ZZZZ
MHIPEAITWLEYRLEYRLECYWKFAGGKQNNNNNQEVYG